MMCVVRGECVKIVGGSDRSTMGADHTPGPWTVDPRTDPRTEQVDRYWLLYASTDLDYDIVAEVYSEADARLIAAAPDLLAALENACTLLMAKKIYFHQGMVAIAAAKGET